MYYDLAKEGFDGIFRRSATQTLTVAGFVQYAFAVIIAFFTGPSMYAMYYQPLMFFIAAYGGTLCFMQAMRIDNFAGRYGNKINQVLENSDRRWAGNIYSTFLYLGGLTIYGMFFFRESPIILSFLGLIWVYICSSAATPRMRVLINRMNHYGLTNINTKEANSYLISSKGHRNALIVVFIFGFAGYAYGSGSFHHSINYSFPKFIGEYLQVYSGMVIGWYHATVDFAVSGFGKVSGWVGSAISFVDGLFSK